MNSDSKNMGPPFEDSWEKLAGDLFGIDFSKERTPARPSSAEPEPPVTSEPADEHVSSGVGEASVNEAAESELDEVSTVRQPIAEDDTDVTDIGDNVAEELDDLDDDLEEVAIDGDEEELSESVDEDDDDFDEPAGSTRSRDTYWDALENWNWEDNDGGESPARDSGRRASSRPKPQRHGKTGGSKRPSDRSSKTRPDRRSERPAKPASKPSPASVSPPVPPKPPRAIDDDEDDDFGAGLLLDGPEDARQEAEAAYVADQVEESDSYWGSLDEDDDDASVEDEREDVEADEDAEVGEEEDTDDSAPARKKRRRRRRRRRTRGGEDRVSGDVDAAEDDESATEDDGDQDEDHLVEAETGDEEFGVGLEEDEDEPKQPARRRSSRRRRRRRKEPTRQPASTTASSDEEEDLQDEAEVLEDESIDGDGDIAAEDDDDEDDTLPTVYRNTPTWEEAISYLLDPSQVGAKSRDESGSGARPESPKPTGGRRGRRRR